MATADMSEALILKSVTCDLHIRKNNTSHNTSSFGEERLIVRRGHPFSLTLHAETDKDWIRLKDYCLSLVATRLPRPKKSCNEESGTKEPGPKVTFALHQLIDETQWSALAAYGPERGTIIVSISSPADAPIGDYTLDLDQQGKTDNLGEFTLLFNPWCPKDAVYMPEEERRLEYILDEEGMIYKGTFKWIRAAPWHFGQFESGILGICLTILDCPNKDFSARKDPISVSRMLSAMINSNDDGGVLVGSWSDYTGGVVPWEWEGSAKILRQWYESGPVRFGQCWVFAAVACTVFRVLGIPCRVVTNFESAHDSNGNLSIDKTFTLDGGRISGGDSVWNFHVWVECWMKRPDLGAGYDGWQVCDPTPQETSDGVYCCGPAPVKAIKEGDLTMKYDAPFVFAEVNADVVTWLRLKSGEKVKLNTQCATVGRCISTKAVGSNERCDITCKYKCAEGSEEERHTYEKAEHRNKLQKQGKEPGLKLKIKLAKDMVIGNDFEVCAQMTNNCMETKTFDVEFWASALDYNGKVGQHCGTVTEEASLAPDEVRCLPMKLEYRNYASAITAERLIKLTVMTMNNKCGEYNQAEKKIVLDGPDVEIKLSGEARVNQPVEVELTMPNTLPEKLQDCTFTVQGCGLTDLKISIEPVGPNEEAKAKVELKPTTKGCRMLVVSFNSDKLVNIRNSLKIFVKEPLP